MTMSAESKFFGCNEQHIMNVATLVASNPVHLIYEAMDFHTTMLNKNGAKCQLI